MRHLYRNEFQYLTCVLLVLALFLPGQLSAQESDTLVVEWWDDDANDIIANALVSAIENDTDRPDGRVYKLQWGGFYWNTETIVADFHLRIVGEKEGTPLPGFPDQPPIVQVHTRSIVDPGDDSATDRMLTAQSDLTLKNVYFLGNYEDGDQAAYMPLRVSSNNSRIVFDNVIFERTNFSLPGVDGEGNTIIITNSVFRNKLGRPIDQQWQGRGIRIEADQDTVIIENNTFFNINHTAFQLEGNAARYARFNHNTVVNIGRGFISGTWWRDFYVTNNLLINAFFHGEGDVDFDADRDPRSTHGGHMNLGALPSHYGPEQGRRILLSNNAAWLDPKFLEFYGDTIVRPWWTGPITQEDYFDVYENMVARDTLWLTDRPDFPVYFSDTFIDSMWAGINDLRAGIAPGNATQWFWMLPTEDPHVNIRWPLPEDFSYSSPSNLLTAGTDGLPLGDLNWHPDAKATFEANKEEYIQSIHEMAGPIIEFEVVDSRQAQDGILGGTSEIGIVDGDDTTDDPPYWIYMENGNFEWEFELDEAGQYDLNVLTHLRGNSARGQRVIVNGVSIKDPLNYGEYMWDAAGGEGGGINPHVGMPTDEWTWTLIRNEDMHESTADGLILPAGTNTIRIESSWGWQNFAEIEVIPAGGTEPAVVLSPLDLAAYQVVEPRATGQVYTPGFFRFVDLGSDGSITWDMTAPSAGEYTARIFYQNLEGPVAGTLTVNGDEIPVNFDSDAEGEGLDLMSDVFDLSEGTYTFVLSGSDVKVDFIQLVRRTVVVSVPPRGIVEGFQLSQNYPNPFNPSTTIQYSIPHTEKVTLKIYNILGQEIATLVNDVQHQGTHVVTFDASRLASGVYLYRIQAGDFTEVKKMMFLK